MALFAFIQMYMVFREDIMNAETVISNIVDTIRIWKRTLQSAPSAIAEAAEAVAVENTFGTRYPSAR